MLKPLSNILIKPAGPDCNLACEYCFYRDKASLYPQELPHRMTSAVLRSLMQQLLAQGTDQIAVAWQGGEPTLMGIEFYRQAIDFQRQFSKGKIVGNSIQTNGILIDDRWIPFLKKNNFLVGLSLDGPQHIHDYYRKDCGGKGSWKKVSATALRLLQNGVAVNALTAVNAYSVHFADEIYNYLKSLGFRYLQFIPIVEFSGQGADIKPFSVAPRDYGEFLKRLFDRWMDDFQNSQPTISVRYFESLFFRFVGLQPPDCTLMEHCGPYLVVEHNGDVYACDFFVETDWKLGNILENRLIDLLNSDRQESFGNCKLDLPQRCRRCRWLEFCFGGCLKDRIGFNQTGGLNYFCESVMTFLEYADERFRSLADSWQQKNRNYQSI